MHKNGTVLVNTILDLAPGTLPRDGDKDKDGVEHGYGVVLWIVGYIGTGW